MTETDLKVVAGIFALVVTIAKAVAASNGRIDYPPENFDGLTADQKQKEKRKEKNAKRRLDWANAVAHAATIWGAFVAVLLIT